MLTIAPLRPRNGGDDDNDDHGHHKPDHDPSDSSSGCHAGCVVGFVIFAVVFAGGIVFGVIYFRHRRASNVPSLPSTYAASMETRSAGPPARTNLPSSSPKLASKGGDDSDNDHPYSTLDDDDYQNA